MTGRLARAVAGALWLPRGITFLVFNPSLLPLVVLPAIVAGFLLAAGVILGAWAAPLVEARIAERAPLPQWLELLRSTLVWVAALTAGAAVGFGAALLLVAPILDRLSRRVEAIVRGSVGDLGSGLAWEIRESIRGAFYFLAAAPGIFVLALIPVIGPALALLWAGSAIAFQFSDPPLTRRGLGFRQKRAWHRRHRPEVLGFGLAGLVALLVPFADLLVAPSLAVGGTLLVLDLEDRDGAE